MSLSLGLCLCLSLSLSLTLSVSHRDVKPSNVFLVAGPNGQPRVKLGDFGLARRVEDETPTPSGLPLPRSLVGTPAYAAPEMLAGVEAGSPAADVFAAGVIVFELFQTFGTRMERAIALEELREGVVPPRALEAHPEIMCTALRMTAADPRDRPAARDLLRAGGVCVAGGAAEGGSGERAGGAPGGDGEPPGQRERLPCATRWRG